MPLPFTSIAELWRYPVKGMRGERLTRLELDSHGVAGDRRFAVESSGAPRGKPLLSGGERAAMLLYTASGTGRDVYVTSPAGERFCVDDPRLLADMQRCLPGGHALRLVQSAVPLTDVRPVAVLGNGTVAQLEQELGRAVDARRFRANILLDLPTGFAEDSLPGQDLRLGSDAVLHITERDPRCRIVTLDPSTAVADPGIMKHLDRHHEGHVGVYATVVCTGSLRVGDLVARVDEARA
ncbi:MAG: MOSC domain-containing protein [Janthinobacterium lividum]